MIASDLACSKCEGPLAEPFSGTVLTDDGKQISIRNEIYDGSSGKAVVVYMHGICKRKGRYAKIAGRGKRAYFKHKVHRQRTWAEVSMADQLRSAGFDVYANGHRYLMVIPGRAYGEVKKL